MGANGKSRSGASASAKGAQDDGAWIPPVSAVTAAIETALGALKADDAKRIRLLPLEEA